MLVNLLHKPLIKGRRTRQPAGAVLIVVVIAITLVASLGAALYTLSSSSTYGNLSADLSSQAFYTTESGYRYAVSEYRQFEDEDKDEEMADIITRMEEIHGEERTLPNGLGAFTIRNRPYFFIIASEAHSGDTDLSVRTPGEFPSDFIVPDDVWIYIDGTSDLTLTGNNTQTDLDTVTFDLSVPLDETFDEGTIVYLAAKVSGVNGDILTLEGDVTDFFPDADGEIEVKDLDEDSAIVYPYETCERQGNDTELSGIDDLETGDYVILRPMVQLDITGETAGGEAGGVFGRTREITYLVSITDEILMADMGDGSNDDGDDDDGGDGDAGTGAPGWGGRGGDGSDWNNPDWDKPGNGDPGWSDPDWGGGGNGNTDNGNNGGENNGNGNNGNGNNGP